MTDKLRIGEVARLTGTTPRTVRWRRLVSVASGTIRSRIIFSSIELVRRAWRVR